MNEASISPSKQEHFALQCRNHFRLTRGAFQKAAAHDTDTNTGASCAKADHQADTNARVGLNHRQVLQILHLVFLSSW